MSHWKDLENLSLSPLENDFHNLHSNNSSPIKNISSIKFKHIIVTIPLIQFQLN